MAKNTRKLGLKKHAKQISKDKDGKSHTPKENFEGEIIVDYFNLCTKFELHIKEYRHLWKVTLEESLVFYKVDISDCPKIVVSIKINKNLQVQVFTEYGKVKKESMKFLLNDQLVVEYWSQLRQILEYFGNENANKYISFKHSLTQALQYLRKCIDNCTKERDDVSLKEKLDFIFGQLYALRYNRYTHNVILFACSIYLKSSICYDYLKSLKCLILPKEEELVNYINKTYMEKEN